MWWMRRWIGETYRRQPARLFLIGGAALAIIALVGCGLLLVVGTAVGAILANRGGETEPVAVQPSATATPDLFVSPLEPATAGEVARAAATDTPLAAPETPPPSPSPASGALLPAGDVLLPVATLPPVDVPAPESALELTPTSQLTLAAVILVENAGQFPAGVRFQARGAAGGGLWLAPEALWLTLLESSPVSPDGPATETLPDQGVNLRLSFVGANPKPQMVPFGRLDTRVSYFRGSEPAGWHRQVPVWSGVRYQDLYPGVDLEIGDMGGHYGQRLVFRGSTAPAAVRLQVEGAQGLALLGDCSPGAASGQAAEGLTLCLTTAVGQVAWPLFQAVDGEGQPLAASADLVPRVQDGNVVGAPFYTGTDAAQADPLALTGADQIYANALGQGGNDASLDVAVDDERNVYVTGHSYVPTVVGPAGSFDVRAGGSLDAFAFKMSGDGSEVVYGAFLGGKDHDTGQAIAVDERGSAYLAGVTYSPDLPGTAGHLDATHGGQADAFALKLDAAGTEVVYATYLGGAGDDRGQAIAVDRAGSAYVAGTTGSRDMPATQGAWDILVAGEDAFVLKLDPAGNGLAYGTFLGGRGDDRGQGLAVDALGRAVVVGTTRSADMPATVGALDTELDGDSDGFVTRLNETGTGLLYSSFLGGQGDDGALAVALDRQGQGQDWVYVAGTTRSSDLATTAWAFDTSPNGGLDGFVAKMDLANKRLDYAGLLGGSGDDWAQAVAVDSLGNAYVAGATQGFAPAEGETAPAAPGGGQDAFVARVDPFGLSLTHVSSLGSRGRDQAVAIDVDSLGSIYVVGNTTSTEGGADAFMSKLVVGTPFLDLPVAYTNFAQTALGNVGDRGPGRVNSWFDHSSPNHTRNRNLSRWDGITIAFDAELPSRIGEGWYDGHGGTDFGWVVRDEAVYAAAPGLVIDTVTNCRVGNQACGDYFGNRVWIDHGNGYATVYAHLKSVQVEAGTAVQDPAGQPLGIMGNTGRSLGTHLHFGLYFDSNRDGRWTHQELVDPYGWLAAGRDPWRAPSRYLWKHPLWTRRMLGPASPAADRTLASPSGMVTVTVPAAALVATATLELWDVPPGIDPAAGWRPTGYSFLLTGQKQEGDGRASALSLALPVTITLTGKDLDSNLRHVNPSKLTLRRWDESGKGWQALPTTVNSTRTRVTARTTDLGRFDLHAPLVCPADIHEPDDHYGAAQTILPDGSRIARLFDIDQDVDWFLFEARAGSLYEVEIVGLAAGLKPEVGLYDSNTVAPLAAGKSGGEGKAKLTWRASLAGSYLLRASQAAGGAHGCTAGYVLQVREVHPPEAVTIAGPDEGKVQASYTFTATASPLAATQPLTYSWQVPGPASRKTVSNTLTLAWETPGTYRLVVTATNSGGSVTTVHAVVIHPPIQAAFSAAVTTGPAPLKVTFANSSVGDYADSLWDFGDGKTSKTKSPEHTYEAAGTYTVTLTISGVGGKDSEVKAGYIRVEQATPAHNYPFQTHLPLVVKHRQ